MFNIIGCPRSGTLWMYYVLREVGLDVSFERDDAENIVDWHRVSIGHPQDAMILHQVRHPLGTMSSMQTLSYPSWNYVANSEIVDIASAPSLWLQVMRMWYFWNLAAEAKAQYTYCIENIDKCWPTICKLIGLDEIALPEIARDCNTRVGSYIALNWHGLEEYDGELCQQIKDLAIRYGYNLKTD